MEDILDDDFEKESEQKEQEKNVFSESLKPYLYVKAHDLEEVEKLLQDNEILYETQAGSMFDDTGLIPLTTNQLGSVKTTFFVQEKDIEAIDILMESYYQEKAANATENNQYSHLVYWVLVLAIIIGVLIKLYWGYKLN